MSLNFQQGSVNVNIKSYDCESCGKSFSQAHNLTRHIHTIHENHKDYKCESCGKSFSQAGNLKTHIHIIHDTTNVTYATKHNRIHKLAQ